MLKSPYWQLTLITLLASTTQAQAFRNCASTSSSEGYRGESHYLVGELVFDSATGSASGTETHFNYSNLHSSGVVECHITYETNGVYEAGSSLFLLEGNRTSQSSGCDPKFIESSFPDYVSYTLHAEFKGDGTVAVIRADSGEAVGQGDWAAGHLSYQTQEICQLY